jgi:hypothetical protein
VCGQPAIVYPPEIRPWASYYGRPELPSCPESQVATGPLRITSPANGARFLLEPFRPATQQRPLLAAAAAGDNARWTIDGEPADRWVPTPGTHQIVVARGSESDTVTVTYE